MNAAVEWVVVAGGGSIGRAEGCRVNEEEGGEGGGRMGNEHFKYCVEEKKGGRERDV